MRRLDAEMDNLQAVADWLAAHGQWGELLGLGRELFEVAYICAPVEGGRWYRDALDHDPDLDGQERVDALGELDALKMFAGEQLAPDDVGPSITLADASGLLHSPWAWEARFSALNAGDDPPGARAAAETVLAIAEERHDHFATMTALATLACGVATVGELAESERLVTELLRQAHETQNPTALAWAVIGAAGSYITARLEPDFASGMLVLEANPVDADSSGPTMAVWLHRIWGLAHLGLGHADLAVQHLARSMRVADERYPALLKSAALALAVALGNAGYPTLAVQLGGYSEGHFATHTMRDFSHTWLQPRLAAIEATLADADRAAALEVGAGLDRRGFMRLLADAERSVDSQGTQHGGANA